MAVVACGLSARSAGDNTAKTTEGAKGTARLDDGGRAEAETPELLDAYM